MRKTLLALIFLAGCKDNVTCGASPCGPCPEGAYAADECTPAGWKCTCVPGDLAGTRPEDMTAPEDLATPPDLAAPDLARPPDLASPRDLVPGVCIYDGIDPCALIECVPGKVCKSVVAEDGGAHCVQLCQ